MFCIKCGGPVASADAFCIKCGTARPRQTPPSSLPEATQRSTVPWGMVATGITLLIAAVAVAIAVSVRRPADDSVSSAPTSASPTPAVKEDSQAAGAKRERTIEEILADHNMADGVDAYTAGRYADALYFLAKEVTLDAANDSAIYYLAHTHSAQGDQQSAAAYFRQFLRLAPATDSRRESAVDWLRKYDGPEAALQPDGLTFLDGFNAWKRDGRAREGR